MSEEHPRVCVTGVGVVSPYGRTAADLWAALISSRSAIRPIRSFDASELPCRIAGEIDGYTPRDDMDKDAAAALDRRSLFAADAAIQGLIEADVPINAESVAQIGVAVGCEVQTEWRNTAMDVARTVSAAGPVLHISNAAVSGLAAIGEAAEWIRREDCSIAVAGGAEAPVTRETLEHFMTMLTKNNEPAAAVRPFGEGRDGFALSEGAAMLVLEDEAVAARRGAHILAYIDGYGATFSRSPVVRPAPNPVDAGRAMQAALIKWELTLQAEIDGIFASAGGGAIDIVEAQAIRRIWGPNADKLWVTAIKGALGHTLGASGAMSAVAAVFALQAGLIPPTPNTEPRDAECGELELVRDEPRRLRGTRVMVNAIGIGHNASMILSKP